MTENINVRIHGTANVTQMSSAFGKLQAEVTALNAQLAHMVNLQDGVDPKGYSRMTKAAAVASQTYRDAAASTGMFEVQQLRLNRATDDYVTKLQKQQMSFRQMAKQRKIANAAYKEQLAMQQMVVSQSAGSLAHGRNVVDVAYPRVLSKDISTAATRLAWFNEELRSGAHQMVNWGKNTQWAGRQLMVGFTIPIAAAGAAAGVLAYQMDKEFTRIAKVYDTTADSNSNALREQMKVEAELKQLREDGTATAIESAKQWGASATDTLAVQAELAATGQKGADLQKATAEIMRISKLGEMDYQETVKATIAMQTVFNQSTKELTESFNYMNAIENATSLTTQDFAAAIPIAAAPIKAFGGDIKELGTLLTAMRSRGIEATQGANAIKAAMQRLGRPSKQVKKEWTALTGTDITEIFEKGESLTEIFQGIGEATDDLTNKEKIKAFAALFGTYQVTRMSAMVDGLKDLGDATTQTGMAYEIAGESAKKHADIAEREGERYRNSISGMWETSFNEFKIQLSTMGQPFVQMATLIIKGMSSIIKAFNDAPSIVKWAAAVGIGIAALAGPVIMMAGLFGNLLGSGLKWASGMIGAITKYLGVSEIMTREQRASALAAEMETTAFTNEIGAVDSLTMHINKLTQARKTATAAAAEKRIGYMTAGGMSRAEAIGQLRAERLSAAKRTGGVLSPEQAEARMRSNLAMQREQEKSAKRTATNVKNVAISMGTAAGSAALMFAGTEGAVGEMAEIVFYASMFGGILSPVLPLIGDGFKRAKERAVELLTVMKAQSATAKGTAAASAAGAAATAKGTAQHRAQAGILVGGLAKVSAGFKRVLGIVKAISKAMGPVGWAIAGIGAGVAIWKALDKHITTAQEKQAKMLKEQRDAAKAISNAAEDYASASGKALKDLKQISQVSLLPETKTPMEDRIEVYRSEDMKGYMKQFVGGELLGSPNSMLAPEGHDITQQEMAMQRFYELQEMFGMSAKNAAAEIKAMYIAAGDTAFEADRKADALLDTFGDLEKAPAKVRAQFLQNILDLMQGTDDKQAIETYAKTFWDMLQHELESASNPQEVQAVLDPLLNAVDSQWDTAFAGLGERARQLLRQLGVDSVEGFKEVVNNLRSDENWMVKQAEKLSPTGTLDAGTRNNWYTLSNELLRAGSSAEVFEKKIVSLADENFILGGSIENVQDLLKDPLFTTKTEGLSVDNIKGYLGEVNTLLSGESIEWSGLPGIFGVRDDEIRGKIQQLSQLASVHGLNTKGIKSMADALVVLNSALPKSDNILTDYKSRVSDVTSEINRWKEAQKNGEIRGFDPRILSSLAEEKNLRKEMRRLLQDAGIETKGITDTQELLIMLQRMFNGEIGDTKSALRSAASGAMTLGRAMRNAYDFTPAQQVEIRREAMTAIQQDIVDKRNEAFDTRMNNALESRQAYWDNRQQSLSDEMERRSRGLDMKWEKKKDAAENYWESRANAVDKAIKAEEKAEEKRQKMFDAEIARINKLNDMANRNIDFNMAINTGNLDEAAKIRNDAEAEAAARVLERGGKAGSARSARRVDALEKRGEAVDEAREKHMKSLDKQEEAEKRHLDKVTSMREKALDKQAKTDMDSQKEVWDYRKKSLDDQNEAIMGFIAANEKQLKKHLKNVGINYRDFGNDTLKPLGLNWAEYFAKKLKDETKAAGDKLASDNMWKTLGDAAADGLISGMGIFKSPKEVRKYLLSGKLGQTGAMAATGAAVGKKAQDNHSGGMLGEGGSGRKGVARTLKGLHSSEVMVRAQKDEFLVNRHAAKRNRDVLERMNRGESFDKQGPRGARGGYGGAAGTLSALTSRMMLQSIGMQMAKTHKQAKRDAKAQAETGIFGAGASGMYGDREFSAAQLRNAAIIANVGRSMGMSKRDIQIGIMTAIAESGLVNVNYGDRDSLGLFQQRPSMGWGTPEQVTNPQYAARAFFGPLKAHTERHDETPWLAAQHIQRSAFSDGSNYRAHWDSAQAIYARGLSRSKSGGYSANAMNSKYKQGAGGWHRPSTPGKGWSNSHDYRNYLGSPLYAHSDGVVTTSKATTSGGSPGNGKYRDPVTGRGYTSYGETVVIRGADGAKFRYAHLSPGQRYVRAGQRVKGGALIGRSGNTGHSTGPHTHFDVDGNYNAKGYLQSRGISLRKGTEYVNFDNTLANLHKGETVLTKNLSEKFREGVNNFASGGNNEYNIVVKVNGTSASADEIANKVMNTIRREERRKPQSRRG